MKRARRRIVFLRRTITKEHDIDLKGHIRTKSICIQIPNLIKICVNCDRHRWPPDLMENPIRNDYKCQAFSGRAPTLPI